MKLKNKYLRNKIVYNFIRDFRSVVNRFIILNITCITDDNTKTHIN